MITVFTPTYNRAHLLGKLYESLCRQASRDFEWLIVDDGSTDNSRELIDAYREEGVIPISYYRQENKGKHCAINYGIQFAKGELFFIVDSDDVITPDAIAIVNEYYAAIKGDERFCGVCGLKAYFSGEKVGGESDYDVLDCNSFDFRLKYHIAGDMAEVFRTQVLRNYPFPEFEGEKYCAESTVYNRMANDGYIMRYFYKKIYLCDYLPDGLSRQSVKLRVNSPRTACLHYKECIDFSVPYLYKIKSAINYWRFRPCVPEGQSVAKLSWRWCVFMPLGYAMHFKDLIDLK